MNNVTILLAILAFLASLKIKRGGLLGLLILCCLLYPEYMRINTGAAKMSIARFVALGIILRATVQGWLPQLKWVDAIALIFWVWGTVVTHFNEFNAGTLTNRVGQFMDTVMIYFAVRCAIQVSEDIIDSWPYIVATIVPLSGFALYEMLTSQGPYRHLLLNYFQWAAFAKHGRVEMRNGFYRSYVSTSHPITFGTLMLYMLGLIWTVRHAVSRRLLFFVSLIAVACTIFASHSTGPWVATTAFIFFCLYQYRPKWIVPCAVVFIIFVLLGEIVTERPVWFAVLDRLGLDSTTAWYRSQLLKVGLRHIPEYWLVGMVPDSYHQWAVEIDGRGHVDMVNHFILLGTQTGLLGLLLQCLPIMIGIKNCVRLYRTGIRFNQDYAFGMGALILAICFGGLSVSYHGVAVMFLWMAIALLQVEPAEASDAEEGEPVEALEVIDKNHAAGYRFEVWRG